MVSELPVFSLGLWHNFGSMDDSKRQREMVCTAFDLGITHFDLANNYGPPPGSAEENFGRIFARDLASYRDEVIISTKAGYLMWPGPYGEWGSRKYVLSSLDRSLKRLGLDYVDIFYSHRYDPETPLEETMGALDQAVRSGKALYVGISNYPAEQTVQACKILRKLGTPCLIHQQRYSMFHRDPEAALFTAVKAEKIGLIAFCPLAQGLLTSALSEWYPCRFACGWFQRFFETGTSAVAFEKNSGVEQNCPDARTVVGADGTGLGSAQQRSYCRLVGG